MLAPASGTDGQVDGSRTSRRPAILGAAAAASTAVAYLPGLGRSLTYDGAESVGFFVLADSPGDALTGQRSFNNHPLFSFLENLVVHLAGHSDEWLLRLLPIAFAATAVGAVVWAVSRAAGPTVGVAAGAVMATNPMYVELGRAVRGYSLMVLMAVLATILHLRLVHEDSKRHRLAYVVVAVTGLMTHFAVGPVFLAHAVDVVRRRMVDRTWVATWAAAGVLALAFYAQMLDDLLSAGESRGRIFRPWFLLDLARELLGHAWPAVVLLGALVALELYRNRRRPQMQTFAAVTAVVAVVVWLLAPENLAPRFFLWLVPAVAVLAARPAADRPRIAVPAILVAAASCIAVYAPTYTDSVNRYPDVAAVIDRESAAGNNVCVTDLSVPPILAYTRSFEALTDPGDGLRCDVVAIVEPGLDEEYVEFLGPRFPHRIDLDARDPAVILSRRPIEPPA